MFLSLNIGSSKSLKISFSFSFGGFEPISNFLLWHSDFIFLLWILSLIFPYCVSRTFLSLFWKATSLAYSFCTISLTFLRSHCSAFIKILISWSFFLVSLSYRLTSAKASLGILLLPVEVKWSYSMICFFFINPCILSLKYLYLLSQWLSSTSTPNIYNWISFDRLVIKDWPFSSLLFYI